MRGSLSSIIKFVFKYGKIKECMVVGALLFINLVLILPMPLLQKYIIDEVILKKDLMLVLKISILFVFVAGMQIFISIIYNIKYNKFVQTTLFNFRNDIFNKLYRISTGNLKKFHSNYIVNRIFNDTDQLQGFVLGVVFNNIQDIFKFIAGSVIIALIDYRITLALYVLIPFGIILYKFFKKKLYTYSYETKNRTNILYAKLNESINMIETVKKNSWISKEQEKFKNNFYVFLGSFLNYISASTIFTSLASSLNFIGTIIVLILGTVEIIKSRLTFGGLLAITSSVQYIINPIYELMDTLGNYQNALVSYNRLQEIINMEEEKDGKIEIKKIDTISMENIKIEYYDKILFENFNQEFNSNNIYIIIGESGSGKTTLSNLILRYIYPSSGKIKINKFDIEDINMKSLHENISLVEQEPRMFNDTIYNNITYGLKDVDMNELIELCDKIQILQFINNLPEKFNTVVGENSNNISGGEKQRIVLCRALLKKSSVIILDEPSSALDKNNTTKLVNILNDIKSNKIIIIITHSNNYNDIADEIINFN
ncbi:ABC transporter ATP-binding protein/permease [Clostridium felsineum]|uniref:Lipid A export ATP-binding/permease protein MsbA n=1 Tax=Clostridium felsineum TaxID=36839 RepID=A0A1S8LLG2_9CLOT|nr:ABC transporter ATP-binding protein [Clostridium felsineum]URZ08009.1 Lipid A export ATP-binding/permease protein MsbA [Clostridium felsineum]URZ13040.1 Lipid A export ATP-binding/permease protein MsbA [Clostridium felsineum]